MRKRTLLLCSLAVGAVLRPLLVVTVTTVLLFEVGIRVLPYVVSEPLRSMILESQRIPYSNERLLSGGGGRNGILLPKVEKAEIVVVGDSFPFGTYEKAEVIFPSVLEKNLQKKAVNLGIGSQSPPVYNRMVEVGSLYQPKVIFYCLFANDFFYEPLPEVRTLTVEEAHRDREDDSQLFTKHLDGRQKMTSWLRMVTNHLMSYQFYKVFSQPFAKNNTQFWTDGALTFAFAPKDYWTRLIGWNIPEIQNGWRVNVELIREAHRFATEIGSVFQVVLQPSKEMVYAPYVGETGAKIYDETHGETYEKLVERLNQLKIGVIDLTPSLRARAAKKEALYHVIDGHFNALGHNVVADILAERYRALNLQPN